MRSSPSPPSQNPSPSPPPCIPQLRGIHLPTGGSGMSPFRLPPCQGSPHCQAPRNWFFPPHTGPDSSAVSGTVPHGPFPVFYSTPQNCPSSVPSTETADLFQARSRSPTHLTRLLELSSGFVPPFREPLSPKDFSSPPNQPHCFRNKARLWSHSRPVSPNWLHAAVRKTLPAGGFPNPASPPK